MPRTTLASAAYDALRAQILSGRLRPGHHVTVRLLVEEFGLSPTPIKAAMTALEREGFLVAVPHRGFFVPDVSVQDMDEIYQLREVIDGIAGRRASRSLGAGDLVHTLEELLTAQRTAVASGDLTQYSDLDLQFHRAIWHASGNRRLAQVAENLLGQLRIGSGTSAQVPGRLALALTEHAQIVQAIQRHRPAEAERATRNHVRLAGDALRDHLRPARAVLPAAASAPRRRSR